LTIANPSLSQAPPREELDHARAERASHVLAKRAARFLLTATMTTALAALFGMLVDGMLR